VPRLALTWALQQSPVMVPIPGATRAESILDNLEARSMWLADEEVHWLNHADPER
jgi:aryl-alcohol dehydrogenase-like predicted oxidoreductase